MKINESRQKSAKIRWKSMKICENSRFWHRNPMRSVLFSSAVTCDTLGPDSSSSSPACGFEPCKKCTTILAKTPHHRACVGIMCYTFSKKTSSSSGFLGNALKGVTPPYKLFVYCALVHITMTSCVNASFPFTA